MWSCLVSIVAGLWVMMAPSIAGMSKQTADLNHICGPLFITFALIALWDINKSLIRVNIAIALFLTAATLLLRADTIITASNILSGAIVIVCALVKRSSKQKYGGGWRSLFQKDPVHLTEAQKRQKEDL